MEAVTNKEALKLTEVISSLELPVEKRNELTEAIKLFAIRERQEGFNDGVKEVMALLKKGGGQNGQQTI